MAAELALPMPIPRFDTIPAELRALPRWVNWRYERRGDKPTKVPVDARTGRSVAVTDPASWRTFEEVVPHARRGEFGIGFIFAPDDSLAGVDLDRCRDPHTGTIEPWATDIVATLDSYTEVSPSGSGLKVFMRGSVPPGRNRKDRIEMYDSGRFFTVTGQHHPGTPVTIEERDERLAALHGRLFVPAIPPPTPISPSTGSLTDEQVIEKARGAANGPKFARLWSGDTGGYTSHSEADLALCDLLAFWTGRDEAQIDRLFRRSGLYRSDKWGREDYRRRTIDKALTGGERYSSRGAPSPNMPPRSTVAWSATELLRADLPEPTYAVPELVPEGLTLLVGRGKIGKSWLILQVAAAIASGGTVLGRYDVEAGDVLYLALEDTPRRLQARLQQLQAADPTLTGLGRLTLATEWKRTDDGGLADLEAWLDAHPDTRLVIVDTLVKVRARGRNNGNRYEEDYDALAGLKRIADERGLALIVLHHTNKLNAEDPLDTVSGTTGLTGAADAILILRRARGETDGTLFVTGRDVEEQELAVRFDKTTGLWSVVGDATATWLSEERAAVLKVLREAAGPLGPAEIAARLKKPAPAIRALLGAMVKDGQIEKIGYGKYAPCTHTAHTAHTPHTPHTATTSPVSVGPTDEASVSVSTVAAHTSEPHEPASELANEGSVSGVRGVSGTSGEGQTGHVRQGSAPAREPLAAHTSLLPPRPEELPTPSTIVPALTDGTETPEARQGDLLHETPEGERGVEETWQGRRRPAYPELPDPDDDVGWQAYWRDYIEQGPTYPGAPRRGGTDDDSPEYRESV